MNSARVQELGRRLAVQREGRLTALQGTVLRALVPDARLGQLCLVERPGRPPLEAEVIGFDLEEVLMAAFDSCHGVSVNARVEPREDLSSVPAGDAVVGRVIDALGRPLDVATKGPLPAGSSIPLTLSPPNPLERLPIDRQVVTGIRSIDGLLPLGRGQRVGLFSAAGVGKSSLLARLAKHIEADRVVLALIGERGREVRGFLEDYLGAEGLAKTTVVVSTSDQPALLRLRAAHTATAIAVEARERGLDTVLLMDSVTRFARALREVGLAAGEPIGQGGYPASVFAQLPVLFERAGNSAKGTLTAIYTVLVAGDDLTEPIADETLSLLDGHLVLSRQLARRRQFPPIDVSQSESRLFGKLVHDPDLIQAASYAKQVIAFHEEHYHKITTGLFAASGERERRMLQDHARLLDFLAQDGMPIPLEVTRAELLSLLPRGSTA